MTSPLPKVSIICICFNQGQYVEESMLSVLNQTYKNCELIVVDDGSRDGSVSIIERFKKKYPQIVFINLQHNEGICKAFNRALKSATGDYIIDLAADDILLPQRLEHGIKTFQNLTAEYGVIFSDAEWIDEMGNHLSLHSEKFPHDSIPQGDVYKDLIERYFICSPTMMFRKGVIEKLGGYDERLTYEDFDFWIRSSRFLKYYYSPEVLVKKRKLKNSLSEHQFKIFNKQNYSTYRVCHKIMTLNRTSSEQHSLQQRIQYEIRKCIKTLDIVVAYRYFKLWLTNKSKKYP